METTEYIPYGPEWVKEMKKLPKDFLIEMARKSFIKQNKCVELLKKYQHTGDKEIDSFLKENNP